MNLMQKFGGLRRSDGKIFNYIGIKRSTFWVSDIVFKD